jgi:predicted deacylase
MLEKYEFSGKQPGIHLLILAAIHGNEQSGTKAVHLFLDDMKANKFTVSRGKLTIIPICNPEAFKRDVRQIDENLNRVMKIHANPQTYEQRLANEICPLIKDCDVMLDLHSTHCEGDIPFAFLDYPDENNQKLISVLPVDFVLEGWPNIYAVQSEIQDLSTERAAHEFGKSGTTLECGFHKSKDAVNIAYQAIVNALSVFNMLDNTTLPEVRQKKRVLLKNYVIKRRDGSLLKNYKHLDRVIKGEEIARYDDGEVILAPDDGFILLPNLKAEIGAEWYYFGI